MLLLQVDTRVGLSVMGVDMVRNDSHHKIDEPSIRIGIIQKMHLSSQHCEQGDRIAALCWNTFGIIH